MVPIRTRRTWRDPPRGRPAGGGGVHLDKWRVGADHGTISCGSANHSPKSSFLTDSSPEPALYERRFPASGPLAGHGWAGDFFEYVVLVKSSLSKSEETGVIRRGGAPPGAAAFIITSDVWEQTTALSAAVLQTIPQNLHFLRIVLRNPHRMNEGSPLQGPSRGTAGQGIFLNTSCLLKALTPKEKKPA
jgi:hypothetical protein